MLNWVKKVYIYLFTAIGLIILVIGAVQLVDLGLRTWIFTKADLIHEYPLKAPIAEEIKNGETSGETSRLSEEELEKYRQDELIGSRQRKLVNSLALIIVGLPLFLYHWGLARKIKE